jgi:hypothetical protein
MANPIKANLLLDYLDRVFLNRMLALNARMGDSWAPSSPNMNSCDFFL